jgi:hypothetical protein
MTFRMKRPATNAWRRRWFSLCLAFLVNAVVIAPAQPPEEEDQFQWMRMQFTETSLGLEVEGEKEIRSRKDSPGTMERSYLYVAPMLNLGMQGSIYHPNLALFNVRLEDGLSWQQQSINQPVGLTLSGTESKIRFLERYQTSLQLLQEKPYATRIFAEKDHNFRQFDFFNRVTVDNRRYGGQIGYTEGVLPFHVNYTRLEEDITGFTRPSTLRESTLAFDMQNERQNNASTSLSYMLDSYNRQESDMALQQGTYHTVNLSDREVWGRNDRVHLNSSLFYNRMDDSTVPTRNLMLTERGTIEHTKTLNSDYNYSYDNRSAGVSDSQGHNAQASLHHQWRERLNTTADVHGQTFENTSPGTSLSGKRYGLGWGSTFTRRVVSWSDLNLGYSGRYDLEQRETSGQTLMIIGEAHNLTDGVVTYLKEPRVVAATIRVTDNAGKSYTPLLDYIVVVQGELTEIRRAPGLTTIPNGGAVLVDYQAYLAPSDDFRTMAQQFQIRLDFFNYLMGVYARLNLMDNRGALSLLTQNITDKVAGADVSWRWLRAGTEYEIFDSNLGPFTSKRCFQSFSFGVNEGSTLSFDLDQSWTAFKDDGRHRTAYNHIARYNKHLTTSLAWSVEGGWRMERGQGFDQNLAIFRTGVEYVRNKLSVKLSYDLQDQDYLGELRQRHFFTLKAKRSF